MPGEDRLLVMQMSLNRAVLQRLLDQPVEGIFPPRVTRHLEDTARLFRVNYAVFGPVYERILA